MKSKLQQGFTLIELLVVITIIAILASLAVPAFAKIQERGQITKGISNCKNVILTLRIYSSDNNGQYPDADQTAAPQTANDAFRLLFVSGDATDERIFGCPGSKFNPDGNIGAAPGYEEAVAAGENHWAMMKGLLDTASGPIVYENPASPGQDPGWNADAAGKAVKGRTWSGGKVIVGLNDGSVSLEKCTASKGSDVKLKGVGEGDKNLFTMNQSEGGGSEEEVTTMEIAE
jgi:prepilin-type N-terminal cleavage/methylation domain-containing protein